MIVAVDFDGTLYKHSFPDIGESRLKILKNIIELKQNG